MQGLPSEGCTEQHDAVCCMLADFNYQTDQVQGYEKIYWGPNYNRLQQVGAELSHSTCLGTAAAAAAARSCPPWLPLLCSVLGGVLCLICYMWYSCTAIPQCDSH
jgi:hypothetical protein